MSDKLFTPMGVASGICMCASCEGRTQERYRMVGTCRNCGAQVLMLFRSGDRVHGLKCPVCGVDGYAGVQPERLATADEIPVVFEEGFAQ